MKGFMICKLINDVLYGTELKVRLVDVQYTLM